MIVYGEAERVENAGDVRAFVVDALAAVCRHVPGIGRHAALVAAFMRAGELVQGFADAEFARHGFDRNSPSQATGARAMLLLAREVDASWRGGFHGDIDCGPAVAQLAALDCAGCPIRTRVGEGYAHYAVYPEGYLEAARRSRLDARTCVVGLRSIGLSLAALVAAALGARPPISLRPVGDPFDRRIAADAALVAEAAAQPNLRFAVVDEGPGQSGSSFAAAARWLIANGVAQDRIHLFPSHGGQPGSAARSSTRTLWSTLARHDAPADAILLGPSGLAAWLPELIGPLTDALKDISAGTPPWRASAPRDVRFERCKFLARAESGTWLVKFAGLGEIGQRKLRDAALLADAGFTPEVAGLCYGFLVQKWLPGDPPPQLDRADMLHRLAAYLAFRAQSLPEAEWGASLDRLRDMAVHNVAEALGSRAGEAMQRRLAGLNDLRCRPVRTDNRLHAWEWRCSADRLYKVDAVDHCESHDLVGCQDIAWDVAGGAVEHGFSVAERELLCRAIAARGVAVDRRLVELLTPCYLAFQLGLWTSAIAPAAAEAARRERTVFYAARLSEVLASGR